MDHGTNVKDLIAMFGMMAVMLAMALGLAVVQILPWVILAGGAAVSLVLLAYFKGRAMLLDRQIRLLEQNQPLITIERQPGRKAIAPLSSRLLESSRGAKKWKR